jgi:Protein of unknown function (DUF3147)
MKVLTPRAVPGEIKAHRFKDYALRFVFGAAITLVAGLIGMWLGPKVGGVLLGFPALLPASLTLIQKKEGKRAASVDSIGAALGAVAMVAFAAFVAVTVTRMGVVPDVMIALAVWLALAVGLYFLVGLVYGREPAAP